MILSSGVTADVSGTGKPGTTLRRPAHCAPRPGVPVALPAEELAQWLAEPAGLIKLSA
ncbi:hypothetical protein [Aromatoleum bremense]|uniref:Uncharacterized protein n=1 Tax=Aromatoleum bremense TaxID=76115 RepID=A0ABX1NSR7_9RHOO|nr:hypothetical protein [Aromatoleum bremense]NMG15021.1 hypothetical protein [Aromatoleum bremense]